MANKIQSLGCGMLLVLAAGGTGFYLGGHRAASASPQPIQAKGELEELFTAPSFSEVQNTKAFLSVLAGQFIMEFRTKLALLRNSAAASDTASAFLNPRQLNAAIYELECGINEFDGTEQQIFLVQELLWLFKRNGLHRQWIELYLRAMSQHPTHSFAGRFAREAVIEARLSGNEPELLNGFRLLRELASDAAARTEVESALRDLESADEISRSASKNLQ